MRVWALRFLPFLLLLSLPAAAGILPEEQREWVIQAAFDNFWGRAKLSDGKLVQPEDAGERATLPISLATAHHVISVGELSGVAEWCRLDWEKHFLTLTAQARRQAFNEKQLAFMGLLHGVAQGNVHSAVETQPCTADQRARVEKMIEASPVSQAILR